MNWTPIITLNVSGTPKGQPRARAFARPMGGGKFSARMYDPGTAEAWKSSIALAMHQTYGRRAPLDCPVSVSIDFYFPRPKRLMRKSDPDGPILHTAKPDRDNAEKACLDCLTTLGVWKDDAQVCAGEVRKFYAPKNMGPGARIVISTQAI